MAISRVSSQLWEKQPTFVCSEAWSSGRALGFSLNPEPKCSEFELRYGSQKKWYRIPCFALKCLYMSLKYLWDSLGINIVNSALTLTHSLSLQRGKLFLPRGRNSHRWARLKMAGWTELLVGSMSEFMNRFFKIFVWLVVEPSTNNMKVKPRWSTTARSQQTSIFKTTSQLYSDLFLVSSFKLHVENLPWADIWKNHARGLEVDPTTHWLLTDFPPHSWNLHQRIAARSVEDRPVEPATWLRLAAARLVPAPDTKRSSSR